MLLGILKQAMVITAFVFAMMLLIEYFNVITRGGWQEKLLRNKWTSYLAAALLGIIPGCLGAFMVVALYSHRLLSLGALVTAMIATSGDETFVMLAMIPKTALLLSLLLLLLGIVAGVLTDFVAGALKLPRTRTCPEMVVHAEESCRCFPREDILAQWRECSPARGGLVLALLLLVLSLTTGQLGPPEWNYIRATFLLVALLALFVVATVPDHFLEEHLWKHVARTHVPRIFLWTFGILLLLAFLTGEVHLGKELQSGKWLILVLACLVGLIPESGPHLIFVTLFAQGSVPLSVLIASSIVQDGHGMLPLLAYSRRDFILVKAVNFLAGLAVGAVIMAWGG